MVLETNCGVYYYCIIRTNCGVNYNCPIAVNAKDRNTQRYMLRRSTPNPSHLVIARWGILISMVSKKGEEQTSNAPRYKIANRVT